MMHCYEDLLWGCLVNEVSCLKCNSIIPHILLTHPNQLEKEEEHSCPSCKTVMVIDRFLNTLGRHLPTFYREGKASSILLMV